MGGKSRKGNRVSSALVARLKENANKDKDKDKSNGTGNNLLKKSTEK